MASEINKVGKGFLDQAGRLKDANTLRTEDNSQAKKSQPKTETKQTDDQSVSTALKPVRSRFNEDINSVISVVNENDENLKKADNNIKEQIKKARELKQALKDGDTENAEKKRLELEKLNEKRNKIAEEIEADNKRLAQDRVQTVSVGNKQVETFKLNEVKFSKAEKAVTEKPKDVNQLIEDLEAEKEAIKVQRQELKEVKKEIKTVVSDVRKEINTIEKNSIKSVEEATARAEKLASDIVKAGSQEALVSNIDETVVKSLIAA